MGGHAQTSGRRAQELWATLERCARGRRDGGVALAGVPGGRARASLWAFSQVLHGAVLLDLATGEPWKRAAGIGKGLEAYRRGPAFGSAPSPRRGARFYDDNAWVALAVSQLRWSAPTHVGARGPGERYATLLAWLRSGEDPAGGVRWREGLPSRHACSTGAVGVAALRAAGPGRPVAPYDLALARRCRDFLAGPLLLPSGLVADHVDDGRRDDTVWSYNQGLLIGLEVLLHGIGEPGALERAHSHAVLTTEWFSPDRLHREPPCFVAVLLRMLLLLSSADGDSRWPAVVDGYLDRVWATARTRHGWRGGDVGRYGREVALDLGGLLQLAALRATDPGAYASIC